MPRNTSCDHPNCDGGPCKALTAEELAPGPDDVALAAELVAGGWVQVSAKHRILHRWKTPPPAITDLIAPAFRGTYFEQRASRMSNMLVGEGAMSIAPRELVEERVLSPREFKAFKNARRR